MNSLEFDAFSSNFFEQLVEQSCDIFAVIQGTGALVYANTAVQKHLGVHPEGWRLKRLLQCVHPLDRRSLWRGFQAITADDSEPWLMTVRLSHPHRHWVEFEVSVKGFEWSDPEISVQGIPPQEGVIFAPSRPPSHYLLTLKPLYDHWLHRSSGPVNHSSRLDTNSTKSQFLAIMSHELRTPINAINGFSQLLLRQRHDLLSAQQEDMVKRILTNGKNLLALINGVLDLSKLEAGRMELRIEALDLEQLVASTIKEIDSLATQNNLSLHTEIHLQNKIIHNDKVRLRQILINLLSNAIKFTEQGNIWILVEETHPSNIRISVQDSGPGIDKEHLNLVFREFWQSDQTNTRKYRGTGLGLAICHNLVKMMQGDIQVHSQPGHGATFRLTIPRMLHQRTSFSRQII